MRYLDYYFRWEYQLDLGKTTCYLEYNKALLFTASCVAGKKDRFDKHFGRKLALKRLLAKSQFSKQERTEIWERYRTMGNKKRW